MRLELLEASLELIVGRVPTDIHELARDLNGDRDPDPDDESLHLAHFLQSGVRLAEQAQRSIQIRYRIWMQTRIEARLAPRRRLTRRESQAATKAALLRSAADLFTRVGYGSTSIEAITEAAGFTRGAFYSNFASKDELFLALVESLIDENLQQIAVPFQQGETAVDRIRSGGALLDSLVERDREWCLLYKEFWAQAMRDPKLRKRFAQQYEVWRAGIAQMIEERYRELGLELDAPPHELASALIALFEGQVMQRLIDPKALDDGFFTRLLLRFFARLGVDDSETTAPSA